MTRYGSIIRHIYVVEGTNLIALFHTTYVYRMFRLSEAIYLRLFHCITCNLRGFTNFIVLVKTVRLFALTRQNYVNAEKTVYDCAIIHV